MTLQNGLYLLDDATHQSGLCFKLESIGTCVDLLNRNADPFLIAEFAPDILAEIAELVNECVAFPM